MVPSQKPFHSISSTKEMGLIDHVRTTAAHKHILTVIGHSHHFMGKDLTNGDDQVIFPTYDAFINHHINGKIYDPFRNLGHILSRYSSKFNAITAPVVNKETVSRDFIAEHVVDF